MLNFYSFPVWVGNPQPKRRCHPLAIGKSMISDRPHSTLKPEARQPNQTSITTQSSKNFMFFCFSLCRTSPLSLSCTFLMPCSGPSCHYAAQKRWTSYITALGSPSFSALSHWKRLTKWIETAGSRSFPERYHAAQPSSAWLSSRWPGPSFPTGLCTWRFSAQHSTPPYTP